MTPQERDVIAGIFDRLRQAANQPRDPEAENFIAERLREQPYAPYAMAQAVYVQEQALANLNQQVESLQAQLREAQTRASEAAQPQAGGFLSGIFGGGSVPRTGSVPPVPPRAADANAPSGVWTTQPQAQGAPGQAMPMQAQAQPGPWSNQPQQQARGGGFMASALTTAAGVAGGMVAGNMLMNAFGGGKSASSEAKPAEASTAQQNDTAAAENAQPASNQSYEDPGHSYQEPSYQNASNEGYDDGSSGFGDDEWA